MYSGRRDYLNHSDLQCRYTFSVAKKEKTVKAGSSTVPLRICILQDMAGGDDTCPVADALCPIRVLLSDNSRSPPSIRLAGPQLGRQCLIHPAQLLVYLCLLALSSPPTQATMHKGSFVHVLRSAPHPF